MTRGELIVRRARSYPPGLRSRPLEVRIEAGRFVQVAERIENDGGAPLPELDAQGLCAIPGLIDIHVHFREPGLEHIIV